MNKNSLKAYKEILADGTLTNSEAEVYTIILKHGPINNRQIDDMTNGQGHKRTRALLESGAIYGVDKLDPITLKTSAFYSVTGDKPIKAKKTTKGRGMDLSEFYDRAFENGIEMAVMHFMPCSDPDEVVAKVTEITLS